MKKNYYILITIGLIIFSCKSNNEKDKVILTSQDSVGMQAVGDVFAPHAEKKPVIEGKEVHFERTEKEEKKNKELIEKVKKDLNSGPFAKMNCQDILNLYIKDVYIKYKEKKDGKVLSAWPLEDAKIKSCMNDPIIKPIFDSLQLEIRKLYRRVQNKVK